MKAVKRATYPPIEETKIKSSKTIESQYFWRITEQAVFLVTFFALLSILSEEHKHIKIANYSN
jgi:hypothetical protein